MPESQGHSLFEVRFEVIAPPERGNVALETCLDGLRQVIAGAGSDAQNIALRNGPHVRVLSSVGVSVEPERLLTMKRDLTDVAPDLLEPFDVNWSSAGIFLARTRAAVTTSAPAHEGIGSFLADPDDADQLQGLKADALEVINEFAAEGREVQLPKRREMDLAVVMCQGDDEAGIRRALDSVMTEARLPVDVRMRPLMRIAIPRIKHTFTLRGE